MGRAFFPRILWLLDPESFQKATIQLSDVSCLNRVGLLENMIQTPQKYLVANHHFRDWNGHGP